MNAYTSCVIYIILILLYLLGYEDASVLKDRIFSGLYVPNTSKSLETYAGAFLVSTNVFYEGMKSIENIKATTGAEEICFAMIKFEDGTNRANITEGVMTRDYLDFLVLHLSSTITALPQTSDNLTNDKFNSEILSRMNRTVELVRLNVDNSIPKKGRKQRAKLSRSIKDQTIVVMPYSNRALSESINTLTSSFIYQTRSIFLETTFWSVFRYFPKIIIATSTDIEYKAVKSLDLPVFEQYNLTGKVIQPIHLPKHALIELRSRLLGDAKYRMIKFVYYTDSDQMLYMRSIANIFNLMNLSNNLISLIPHRMQVNLGYYMICIIYILLR